MDLKEFAETMRVRAALLNDPDLRERLGVVACNQVNAEVKRRVFRDGVAMDGSQIGRYSTKPGYFSVSQPGLPKIAPKGKNGSKREKKPSIQKKAIGATGKPLEGRWGRWI